MEDYQFLVSAFLIFEKRIHAEEVVKKLDRMVDAGCVPKGIVPGKSPYYSCEYQYDLDNGHYVNFKTSDPQRLYQELSSKGIILADSKISSL